MTKHAFIALLATALFLAVVSLFPSFSWLYTSPFAIALWGFTAITAIVAIIRCKLWRKPALLSLHAAFIVILVGAMTTHISGTTERLHLKVGEAQSLGTDRIELTDFQIEYYPATSAPADFVASVAIDGGDPVRVSMNHTADTHAFRLFLSSYDEDRAGCTFIVARDRIGTLVTYCGYFILMLSMLWISFDPKPKRVAATIIAVIWLGGGLSASPRSVPDDVAKSLGNLYVAHNGRVAPLSTLANDFTIKVYGGRNYKGLSAEQVLAGWLFYYDSWKNDPGIKIKDSDARRLMGLDDGRARLTDFFGTGGYLFDDSKHPEANEKFALVSSAAAGSLWKLFPYQPEGMPDGPVTWYSPVDQLPADIDIDSWRMTRHSLGYLAELVANGQWEEANTVIGKIGDYQRLKCPGKLPSKAQVAAERLFLALSGSVWPIVLLIFFGAMLVFRFRKVAASALLIVGIVWVATLIGLNAYASHHIPMGNGYETMQWMSLFATALCLWLGRRHSRLMPLGAIVGGMALAVALMGQSNPQLTNLMPVLRSPLLSVHVLLMMLAYALLGVMALIAASWLLGRRELLPMARLLLRPAVFLLTAGIFIGAVWANVSWGSYWGWDPKEVWALITMMFYCVPLHSRSIPQFNSDKVFAIWILASFVTVIMTYAGVNFLLGGLHSYA